MTPRKFSYIFGFFLLFGLGLDFIIPCHTCRSKSFKGGGTKGCFARSVAKNSAWLATLMTMWKVKFRPILIIPLHLEVWPAEHLPLRSILKFPNFSLKTSKDPGLLCQKKILFPILMKLKI